MSYLPKKMIALSSLVLIASQLCLAPASAQMKLDLNPTIKSPPGESKAVEVTEDGVDTASDTTKDEPAIESEQKASDTGDDVPFSQFEVPVSRTLSLLNNEARNAEKPLLKGRVSTLTGSGRIPILHGTAQAIPEKTQIDLVVPSGVILDSEFSQIGDEVFLRVGRDVKAKDGKTVLLPGQWYVRGLVTRVVPKKRAGRDGVLEIQFDKLISPDNQYEVDLNAKFSSKDKKLKTVAKLIAIDSAYVGIGAGAGALLAYQWGGLGLAIQTYGISIGVGGAIGAGIGFIGAMKRKGNIASFREGQVISLKTDGGLTLPEFDPEALPSAKEKPKLVGLNVKVEDYKFRKVPWKDKKARLLELELSVNNESNRTFHFFDLAVEDDFHRIYRPFLRTASQHISPGSNGSGKITFLVGTPKRKYTLLFFSRRNNSELTHVSIN